MVTEAGLLVKHDESVTGSQQAAKPGTWRAGHNTKNDVA
jgi:hypothetical protein